MSASTGVNPFGLSRGMTRPVQETKAVLGYEGNIDFARQTKNVGEFRTSGRILAWFCGDDSC